MTPTLTLLSCHGQDGIAREFACRQAFGFQTVQFLVRPPGALSAEEFELILVNEGPDRLRVKWMNHHGLDCYARKGIPEAVLLFAATSLGKRIESGPAFSPETGQGRVPEVTKVWERLQRMGKARHNKFEDTYSTAG